MQWCFHTAQEVSCSLTFIVSLGSPNSAPIASFVSSIKKAHRTSSPKHGADSKQLFVPPPRNSLSLHLREEFIAPIPEAERQDLVLAYHAQLNSTDDETRLTAARAWTKWEMWTSKLHVDPAHVAEAEKDDFAK